MGSHTVHISQIADLDKQEGQDFLEMERAFNTTQGTACTKECVHEHYIETSNSKDGIIAKCAKRFKFDTLIKSAEFGPELPIQELLPVS